MLNRLLIAFIACFACASHSAEPARERVSVLVQATHASGVSGLAYSPDERYLVSVGKDGGAKVFDVTTGLVVNEIQPCAYWIHAVTFVSADEVLMSCGDGRFLRWSITSVSPAIVAFTSPDSYAVNLTVMPSRPDVMVVIDNLDRVSVRSVADPSTLLWQARVGRRIRVMQSGPDELLLAYVTTQTGKASVTLERRGLSSGQQLSSVQPQGLNAIDFMAVGEGNRVYGVATIEARPQPNAAGSNVAIDAISGQYVDLHPAMGRDFVGRFAWDGAGTLIGVGENGDLVRWQPGSLNVATANVGRRLTFSTEGAYAFSSGAKRLAWVSQTGTVAEVPLSQLGPGTETIAAPIGVSSVAISGNDELAAVGFFNGTTQLWSLTEGKVVAATRAERVDSIYQLDFDAQGKVLISSGSGVLHAWNPVTDERWKVADAGQRPWNSWSHYRLPTECSRMTKSFGCGPPRPMPPIIRAIDNDRIEGSFETTSMAHASGKVAIAGEFNLMLVDDLRNGTSRDLRQYIAGYSDARAIALSHDATRLAIARRGAKALDILNLSDSSVQTLALPAAAMTLKFIPGSSSTLLAIVGGQLFEVEIGSTAAQSKTTLRGTPTDDAALAMAISDDGNYVAVGGHGGRIHLWDRGHGWTHSTLDGHTWSVMSLEFMHHKPLLLSGSRDGSVRVWNYMSSTQLAQLQTFADGPWLTTDADGFFDGPEEAWRRVLMRVDGTNAALKPNRLAQLLFEPGLLSEVVRTGQPYRNTLLARGDERAKLSPRKLAARVPPKITVSAPTPVRAGVASINVQVTNGGDGMRDLRIFRNGTRIAWVDGALQAQAGAASFVRTFEVALASGANKISAYAFDDIGVQSEEVEAQIAFTPSSPRQARVFALSVGINHYDDSARIKTLSYAEADAEAFYDSMATAFASRSDVARPIRREIVHGKDASRENVLSVISALSACGTGAPSILFGGDCPGPDDVVVIFLAGHGVRLDERFLFLARNSVGADVKSLVDTSISDVDLEKVLAGIDARRVMLVIDSCHSGAVAADSGQRVGPFNTRGLAQLAYEKGMYVLGASQSYQAALEVDRHQHGLLTYALVQEGLLGLSADFSPHNGRILDEEWLRFPVRRVPELQREVLSERMGRGQQLWFPDDGVSTTAIGSVQVPSFYAPPTRGAEPFIMSE